MTSMHATPVAPAPLAAESLLSNARLDEAVAAAMKEWRQAQSSLVGARPARADRREAFACWLDRNAKIRGRAGFYPYVGSGVGRGPLVELLDGSVKWDMICGIGVHLFGHGDPELVEVAMRASLSDLLMQGNLQFNGDSIEFAEVLAAEGSRASRLRHCFVSNSGCMVNEAALKLCQQKTGGAPRILAFANCFMGRSTTMSQIGDTAGYRQGLVQNILVDYMPFYDETLGARSTEIAVWHLKQLVARYPKQHACFVMELVQGEGGFRVAPRSYFEALMRICRESGIPVWADEVQSFGRTECMFAFETLGLGEYIDVATVGKLSQVCACLFREEFNPQPGLLAGTFSASASAFHVGRRALETLRDGGYYGPSGRIAALHRAFRERAEDLVRRRPEFFPPVLDSFGRPQLSHVGGTGGMMRLSPLGGSKERLNVLLKAMFDEGVIALTCGHDPYHLRLLPPIGVMEPAQFTPVFEIIERALGKVA